MSNELQAFHNQMDLLRREQNQLNLEFRRVTLAHSFADMVDSLSCHKDFTVAHLRSIEQFTLLKPYDSSLFKEIGIELLEPVVRLQLLCGGDYLPSLAALSMTIGKDTDPGELLKELLSVIEYIRFGSESQHPLHELMRQMQEEDIGSADVCKSVVSMYVPYILQKVTAKELADALRGLDRYLDYLEENIEGLSACLGTPAMDEVLEILSGRKVAVKFHSARVCLQFLLRVLIMYERAEKFPARKLEVALTVTEIFGDFYSLFLYWNKEPCAAEGFGVLATYALRQEVRGLPLVFSRVGRLQFFLPIAGAVASANLSVFACLLEHAADSLDREFRTLNEPVAKIRGMSVAELFSRIIEAVECIADDALAAKCAGWCEKLLNCYRRGSRCHLLGLLVKECRGDKAKSRVLEQYKTSILKFREEDAFGAIEYSLRLRPVYSFSGTYGAALSLLKLLVISSRDHHVRMRGVYEEVVKPLLNELNITVDSGNVLSNGSLLLWRIKEIREILELE